MLSTCLPNWEGGNPLMAVQDVSKVNDPPAENAGNDERSILQ